MTPEELKALNDTIKQLADAQAELAKNQKVLADTYAADQAKAVEAAKAAAAAVGDPNKGDAPKPLTLDDVAKLLDGKLAERQSAADKNAQRAAFIAEKLKDLPAAYQALLPQTDDAAKLAAAEQTIRETFKADLAKLGVKPGDVGGAATTAADVKPGQTLDYSKMSPTALIAQGLKDSKPMGPVKQS